MLIIFTFAVYSGGGDCSNLYGSPAKVFDGLTKASELVPRLTIFAKTKKGSRMMLKPGIEDQQSSASGAHVALYLLVICSRRWMS